MRKLIKVEEKIINFGWKSPEVMHVPRDIYMKRERADDEGNYNCKLCAYKATKKNSKNLYAFASPATDMFV